MLLVAHDVNPILPFIDRVVYVAGGHVLCGLPDEVITTDTLTRLYGAPVEVLRASDGRLVVEYRDDDPGRHDPTTSATWLPPRATPWTRLGLPLARAASAAATTPSAPAPAWAPMRWRSAERRS